MIFSWPVVFKTAISSSSSSSDRARMPAFLAVFKSPNLMRLTVPFRVTITRYSSVSISRVRSIAVIRSPDSSGRTLTMAVPRAVRPASGIR